MGVGSDLWYQREELYNQRDLMSIVSLYADDAVSVDHTATLRGKEEIRAYLLEIAKLAPDLSHSTSLLIEDGDTVVGEWTMRATVDGAVQDTVGMSAMVIADGKITALRSYFDEPRPAAGGEHGPRSTPGTSA